MRIPQRAAAIAVAALVPLGVVVAAQPAAAVSGYRVTTQFIGGGSTVNVRSASSMSSSILQTLPVQTAIEIDCQLVGSRLGFSQYSENRTWDRLTNGRYVHDVVTTTPGGARTNLSDGGYVAWSSTIPRCSTAPSAAPAPAQPSVQSFRATTQYIGGGATVNIRQSPDIGSPVKSTVANGASIGIVCQLVGSRLGFSQYADNRTWDRLADNTYIHDVVTTTPGGARAAVDGGGYAAWSGGIPRCAAQPGAIPSPVASAAPVAGAAAAIAYAEAQASSRSSKAPQEDIDSKWSEEGEYAGEWSGDCVRLVQIAWKHSGTSTRVKLGGTADLLRQEYSEKQGPAPAGALVFWKADERGARYRVGSAGHVALSDGAGGVYTTIGKDHTGQPIAHMSISDLAVGRGYGTPSGWALP